MTETQPIYTVVAKGTDTFIVNYKFADEQGMVTGDALPDHIQDQLDVWQKVARKEQQPVPTGLTFSYEVKPGETVNQSLYMRSHGSSVWPWLLYSDDIKVRLAPGTLNRGLFCQVTFSSHLLWMIGPESAIVQAEQMLTDYLGTFFYKQASEIHLCADVVGFDFSRLSLAGEQLPFVSRVTRVSDRPVPPTEQEQEGGLTSKEIEALQEKIDEEIEQECFHLARLITTHRRISTIDFASHASPISAQIYNKSLEIKRHKKEWFEPIWCAHGWDGKAVVWRIEFRLKRSWLRNFQLDDAGTTLSSLAMLWRYLTQEWLRFVDLDQEVGVNISRRPTHLVWEVIGCAYDDLDMLYPIDPVVEEEYRLQLLLEEKPLQVLEHAVMQETLATYNAAHGNDLSEEEQKDRQTQMMTAYQSTTKAWTDKPREEVQASAQERFDSLTKGQQVQILEHLSLLAPFDQVQASLIRRERRMARLERCIAGGIGYMRSAMALMPLDELPGYLGEGVRAGRRMPDRLSSFLWFAQRAYDYDQSKGRVHVEEILKKQMAYGFVTAQQFEEERRLYGVELEPEDRAAIDHLLADMQNGRKEQ